MEATGRQLRGSTCSLVELADGPEDQRALYTAIQLHPGYERLPSVRSAMELGESFLTFPSVFGVVPLHEADIDAGRFVYHTGRAWSLAEVLQDTRAPEALGARAAAELAWLGASALIEAAEAGAFAGVYCHGDVSPWRWLLRPDGDLMLIGYGLPEVESLRMRRTGAEAPKGPAFRYAPPERAAGAPEDIRSDLYSLALIVAEVAWGKPVYDGTSEVLHRLATQGAARDLVARLPTRDVPAPLRDLLVKMLQISPSARPADLDRWCRDLAAVVATNPEGPSLVDLAAERLDRAAQPSAWRAAAVDGTTSTRAHRIADLLEGGGVTPGRPAEARDPRRPTAQARPRVKTPSAPLPDHDPVPAPVEITSRAPLPPRAPEPPREPVVADLPRRVPVEPAGTPAMQETPRRPAEPPNPPKEAAVPDLPRRAEPAVELPRRVVVPPTPPSDPPAPDLPRRAVAPPTPTPGPETAAPDLPRRAVTAPAPDLPGRAVAAPAPDAVLAPEAAAADLPRRAVASPTPGPETAAPDLPRRAVTAPAPPGRAVASPTPAPAVDPDLPRRAVTSPPRAPDVPDLPRRAADPAADPVPRRLPAAPAPADLEDLPRRARPPADVDEDPTVSTTGSTLRRPPVARPHRREPGPASDDDEPVPATRERT